MATDTSNHYEKSMTLAEAGQFQEAFELIQTHLQTHPDDPEALNDSAVLLHCMHRSGEGIEFLQRARAIAGDTPEIVWNLAEALLAEARVDEALPLLKTMADNETINIDILPWTITLTSPKTLQEATDLLNWSLAICPEQELLRPMIQVIESRKSELAQNVSPSLAGE
ncbi:hypothetical protein ACFL6U_32635 [Planctomycetota bacterium]